MKGFEFLEQGLILFLINDCTLLKPKNKDNKNHVSRKDEFISSKSILRFVLQTWHLRRKDSKVIISIINIFMKGKKSLKWIQFIYENMSIKKIAQF